MAIAGADCVPVRSVGTVNSFPAIIPTTTSTLCESFSATCQDPSCGGNVQPAMLNRTIDSNLKRREWRVRVIVLKECLQRHVRAQCAKQ